MSPNPTHAGVRRFGWQQRVAASGPKSQNQISNKEWRQTMELLFVVVIVVILGAVTYKWAATSMKGVLATQPFSFVWSLPNLLYQYS